MLLPLALMWLIATAITASVAYHSGYLVFILGRLRRWRARRQQDGLLPG